MKGEFISADGLVIPNNVTNFGIQSIMSAALRGTALSMYMGLANCNPSLGLLAEDTNEPSFANGYARQQITRDMTGWPVQSTLNNEIYYESDFMTFTATGPGFDKPINRLMLLSHATNRTGAIVMAISGALPAALTILPATVLADRKFKYRLYSR